MGSKWHQKDHYALLEEVTLKYFQALSEIGSVTGSEYRVFNWLLRSALPEFVSVSSNVANKLSVQFTPGNQLLISWNGLPARKRRLLLVAHTDHEGFLGRKATVDSEGCLWIHAEAPGGESIEKWHKDAHVHVVFGNTSNDERISGVVEEIIPAGHNSAFECDYARIRVKTRSLGEQQGLCECVNNSSWPVIIYPNFKFERESTEDEISLRDRLNAPFVDNCAGVAIATAVLRVLIEEDAPANISILYTTGEEAGFVGLLRMIEGASNGLQAMFEDAVWLVIDASSQEGSSRTGLQNWHSRRVRSGDDSVTIGLSSSERCPLDVASIRLEDRRTLFDYSVALLLHQASLRVKSKLLSNTENPNLLHWQKYIGVAGEFAKGECEGTVLAHYNELRRHLNRSELARPLRFGSLAIPIINYRNYADYAGFNSGKIEPEITRVGALASAAFILFETSYIVERTYLGEQVYARERDKEAYSEFIRQNFKDRIEELEEELIPMFSRFLERGKELLKPLDRWVETEGRRLITKPFGA